MLFFASDYKGGGWDPFFKCPCSPLPFPIPCPCHQYVLVYARSQDGLRSVRFSAPVPDCMRDAIVEFSTPHRIVSGDLASGLTVAFDSCLTSRTIRPYYYVDDIYVGMISVAIPDSIGCCSYFPWPDPTAESRRIEGTDCDGNTTLIQHIGATFNFEWERDFGRGCGSPSIPYGEYPLSGSEVAAGMVTLDWDCGTSAGTNLGEFLQGIFFGTDPNHLTRIGSYVEPPYDVGPLAPDQTYYWQIIASTDFGTVWSPVWSFTTSHELPVKPITWGGLKALWGKE